MGFLNSSSVYLWRTFGSFYLLSRTRYSNESLNPSFRCPFKRARSNHNISFSISSFLRLFCWQVTSFRVLLVIRKKILRKTFKGRQILEIFAVNFLRRDNRRKNSISSEIPRTNFFSALRNFSFRRHSWEVLDNLRSFDVPCDVPAL